jgi:hypothetical protein
MTPPGTKASSHKRDHGSWPPAPLPPCAQQSRPCSLVDSHPASGAGAQHIAVGRRQHCAIALPPMPSALHLHRAAGFWRQFRNQPTRPKQPTLPSWYVPPASATPWVSGVSPAGRRLEATAYRLLRGHREAVAPAAAGCSLRAIAGCRSVGLLPRQG